MEILDHILLEARQSPSPNREARPAAMEISLLVIHSISLPPGEYGGPYIDDLFCNRLDCDRHDYFAGLRELRVSCHLLIDRQGRLTQYVPFNDQAHHAGVSSFQGRERCNEFSIGIELEGCDEDPFTDRQYRQLTRVSQALMRHYPAIAPDRIAGHADIAPGRKTDPGPHFDWRRYRDSLDPAGNAG